MKSKVKQFVQSLAGKKYKRILFLTCSTRALLHSRPDTADRSTAELPKSTYFAYQVKQVLEKFDPSKQIELIEVPHLKIYPCEGNVSSLKSKGCGVPEALLKDKEKNPSGLHRCWASVNHDDDELWKITKALFDCDAVVFFTSVRWGQTCSEHQKLVERLTWIENRATQLGEEPIKLPDSGIVVVGQNYNGVEVLKNQIKVQKFFGFPVEYNLCLQWQASTDETDERYESYLQGIENWEKHFGCLDYSSNEGELDA